jgi:hypothetical protein
MAIILGHGAGGAPCAPLTANRGSNDLQVGFY